MQKRFFGKWAFGVAAMFAMGLFLSACNKNDDDYVQPPAAGLMTFNMVTDQNGVNIALSGNVLPGGTLPFSSYSGTYFNIVPGNRVIESFINDNLVTLDSSSYTFEQGKYYSLFVTGANNNYRNIVALDNFDSLTASSGKAYVRYVNAIPDSSASTVTIASNGTNVVNTPAKYGQVSEFVAVTPGQLAVSLSNGSNINVSRNDVAVEQQKAYTILLVGSPSATDDAKRVQIRYITNGTVTD